MLRGAWQPQRATIFSPQGRIPRYTGNGARNGAGNAACTQRCHSCMIIRFREYSFLLPCYHLSAGWASPSGGEVPRFLRLRRWGMDLSLKQINPRSCDPGAFLLCDWAVCDSALKPWIAQLFGFGLIGLDRRGRLCRRLINS